MMILRNPKKKKTRQKVREKRNKENETKEEKEKNFYYTQMLHNKVDIYY